MTENYYWMTGPAKLNCLALKEKKIRLLLGNAGCYTAEDNVYTPGSEVSLIIPLLYWPRHDK